MMIGRIENATRVIGKGQGYFELPLRDELIHERVNGPGAPVMVTAWIPTPEEIQKIIAGAPIHLRILGTQHPPVLVDVGEIPA